jgi:hypothetical protein
MDAIFKSRQSTREDIMHAQIGAMIAFVPFVYTATLVQAATSGKPDFDRSFDKNELDWDGVIALAEEARNHEHK